MSFTEWYEHYPKQTRQGGARSAYQSIIMGWRTTPVTDKQLLEAVKAYARINKDTNIQYLPNPARWLEDEMWLDADVQEELNRVPYELTELDENIIRILDEQTWRTWFKGAVLDGSTLIVESTFKKERIENHYLSSLRRINITNIKER